MIKHKNITDDFYDNTVFCSFSLLIKIKIDDARDLMNVTTNSEEDTIFYDYDFDTWGYTGITWQSIYIDEKKGVHTAQLFFTPSEILYHNDGIKKISNEELIKSLEMIQKFFKDIHDELDIDLLKKSKLYSIYFEYTPKCNNKTADNNICNFINSFDYLMITPPMINQPLFKDESDYKATGYSSEKINIFKFDQDNTQKIQFCFLHDFIINTLESEKIICKGKSPTEIIIFLAKSISFFNYIIQNP